MQAFFLSLARKLFLFVFATAPNALGQMVVGIVRPILIAQGIDRAEVVRILALIGVELQGIAVVDQPTDDVLVAEGGAEVVRTIRTYFGVTAEEISDASLGKFLVAAATRL